MIVATAGVGPEAPFAEYDARMQGRPPVILGYHGIGSVPLSHDPIELYVQPEDLAAQVRILQGRGYEFVTMSRLAELLREDGPPPDGVAALTFDDGTQDHAVVVPAVLEELDVPGTVFVCPGLSEEPYPWAAPETGIRFMSKEELMKLSANPLIEIGAHTNRHTELHEADAQMALAEMKACKATLEAMLGVEVLSFCYPRCHYSAAAAASAPLAGFTSAVTCGLRGSWKRFELKREVMHSRDGRLVVGMKLRGRFAGLGKSLAAKLVRRSALATDRLLSTRA